MPFFCHYCGKTKPDGELTKEHVLPRALGGNVEPANPFALDVCRRCNTACGRHVDGPFIRSWLMQMDRAANARRFVDLNQNPTVPLTYMGELPDLTWEGKICDFWFGPAKDAVFHFHERYPDSEEVRTEVGRPLNTRSAEIDPGFVVVYIMASNPRWWPCILHSILDQIDDAPLYFANCTQTPKGSPRFAPVPAELAPLLERLREQSGKPLGGQVAIKIDAGERFLAKLAVGFGSLLLSPSFPASEDAMRLRNYLWEQKGEQRSALQLHGTSFFESYFHRKPGESLNSLLGWKPGHVVLLQVFDRLALSVMLYGSQSATIVVSSNPEHWEGRIEGPSGSGGTVFLIAPGFRRFLGPVPLSRYVAASLELKRGNVVHDVGRFLHQIEAHPEPPPFDLELPTETPT